MKTSLLFIILLTLTGWAFAQGPGSIDNIEVSQRTGEEERVVDIAFTLSGGDYYAIKLGIKFHEDDEFTPIDSYEIIDINPDDIIGAHLDETIIGAIILEQGDVELTWDGRDSYPDTDAAAARVEITATRGMRDIDGNFYKSVIIGAQEWMAENLRVTRYNNEDEIPTGLSNTEWSNTTSGAYAIYNNDDDMLEAYGILYNWYAVDDSRGLCPEGWSVPSDADWTALVNYVVSEGFSNSNVTNGAGNALKSCRQVGHPDGGDCDTSEHPRWNSHSTHSGFDEFGFSALPGGYRTTDGGFGDLGSYGAWWSSTEFSSVAWFRRMLHSRGYVRRFYYTKAFGFSLRCVRDLD